MIVKNLISKSKITKKNLSISMLLMKELKDIEMKLTDTQEIENHTKEIVKILEII